jgi:hypothetical protein
MDQELSNSILFLVSARQALKETIEISEIDAVKQSMAINFVENEATDLQIMGMLTLGEVLEEKYNEELEYELYENFKDTILTNYTNLMEDIDEDALKSIIFEVAPISSEGLSTAKPIMEHMMATGLLEAKKKTVDPKNRTYNQANKTKPKTKTYWEGGKSNQQFSRAEKAKQAARDFKNRQKAKLKQANLKDKAKDFAKKAKDKSGYTEFKQGMKGRQATAAGLKSKTSAKKFAKTGREVANKKVLKGGAKMAAVAAVLTAVIFAGAKVYRDFMTKAKRACRGQSGEGREACLRQFRNKALQAKISKMQSGIAACNNSKNPEKCKAALKNKIDKVKSKMR